MVEPLEQRTLLAASVNIVVSFYGLGGAGGFGNDWLDNIANDAGKATKSTVRKYNEDQGGRALKDTLKSIDTNHNMRIDKSEVAALNLRVIGYSFGGIQAANFARSLMQAGKVVKGYTLGVGVPIKALVTLDPVQSIIKHTDGVPNNVYRFGNYYQQKGGDTKVDVYTKTFNIKVTTITVPDPTNIKGQSLTTSARKSRQIRIDQGPYATQSVKHKVATQLVGKISGKNVNHGTVPFYAYDWAIQDLTS
jgi:hypothetical protein